jgi:hypothetical protein
MAKTIIAGPVSARHILRSRVAILRRASKLTSLERVREYGDPKINLQCAQALFEVYRKFSPLGRYSLSHDNAIQQLCNKLGRIATSPKLASADTYDDLTAYAAIAGECRQVQDQTLLLPFLREPTELHRVLVEESAPKRLRTRKR